jgi:hypothetical protein
MKYKFTWKKSWCWHTLIVIGHRYDKEQDKMVLYFADGGLKEISEWVKCSVKLGQDWLIARKAADSQPQT